MCSRLKTHLLGKEEICTAGSPSGRAQGPRGDRAGDPSYRKMRVRAGVGTVGGGSQQFPGSQRGGIWLAQFQEHVTFVLGVLRSSPSLDKKTQLYFYVSAIK